MRLRVTHRTTYTYDAPQRAVLQSQRLIPSEFDGQQVLDWGVEVPGGIEGSRFRDGAGDETRLVRVTGPVSEVSVMVTGLVETLDLAGVLRGYREKVPPLAYLRETRATRADLALEELAREAVAGIGGDADLDRAHALAGAVAEAITYTPAATDAHTTAAEALAGGAGVCQDHAHVLIAAARVLEIPARYVAGYLHGAAPDGAPDAVDGAAPAQSQSQAQGAQAGDAGDVPRHGAQASHAWAELHIPGLGWVGFDAANGCCPDDRYIRLCSGFDAFDAAPIRGLATGQGAESLAVDVAVSVQQ